MPSYDAENLPEREEDIDYSDIEAAYQVDNQEGFDTIVIVDNAPVVDDDKVGKLNDRIGKVFSKVGPIKEGGVWIPMEENNGKKVSKGYIFIDYETPEAAALAVKTLHHTMFGSKNQLQVNRFSDVERYKSVPETFEAPEEEDFEEKEHLRSWLTDPQSRDQFVMYRGDDVSIYWNRKSEQPDHEHSRTNWTETYVQWSPLGAYLATFHRQGIALWGGPSWNKIIRFVHPGVKLIDFSPNERYLITWSNEPLSLHRIPEGSPNPFTEDDEGNQAIVWDTLTGALLRSFPNLPVSGDEAPRAIVWPMFRWSATDKYFARITPGQQISVYEAPDMGLVDKKSLKIDGVMDFEWAPRAKDADPKKDFEEKLVYWTPEMGNQPARVTLISFPTREVIRTKNLFNVNDCKLHWQSSGQFLAVKVDRHTKTKKSTFTNLEIFNTAERTVPVETLEIKDVVLAFAWEPNGERFAVITTNDPAFTAPPPGGAPGQQPTYKTNITFYHLDKSKTLAVFKPFKTLERRTTNHLFWSPKGRHIVLATLRSSTVWDLDFVDLDFDGTEKKEGKTEDPGASVQLVATQEHYGVTDVEWDPTGRYVITGASMWRPNAGDHGYCIWDFKGQLLYKQNVDKFKQLLWRPRPSTLLTKEQQKKIRKNLRDYSKTFEEEDLAATQSVSKEIMAHRKRLLDEWYNWRKRVEAELAEERAPSLGNPIMASNYKDQYANPFSDPAVNTSDPLLTSIEPDVDIGIAPSNPSTSYASPRPTQYISGNIGSSTQANSTGTLGADGYTMDTLDEPVTETIMRDVRSIAQKLRQVLHPKGRRDVLKDWDLWGPLILCLALAILLSIEAPEKQAVIVFTGVFVIVWVGAAVVTLNAKLLGGAVSFFQSVCVLGYCLFPLVIAALVGLFVRMIWVRLPLAVAAFGWSTFASVGFFSDIQLGNRRALAVYPMFLFYFIIAWMVLISKNA
ncbi:hypothetical protein BZG36_05011 [Bifiguratus adelaidae]|uniref:Eukaryotic translation initiation factor 3 subunit B n=1 Tax=Bifiguratus adelaidae TaxID=1938954 RepID=A0A261XU57_9FUNG|nr:hypothetical protein BZG36_05011 [Bifiguratus adelaidae]